jgi:hypothetical protein
MCTTEVCYFIRPSYSQDVALEMVFACNGCPHKFEFQWNHNCRKIKVDGSPLHDVFELLRPSSATPLTSIYEVQLVSVSRIVLGTIFERAQGSAPQPRRNKLTRTYHPDILKRIFF